MAHGVVLAYTIHAVLRLEKELKSGGLTVKPVRTPRHLSSDCGTALRFDMTDIDTVRAAIDRLGLEVQQIAEL